MTSSQPLSHGAEDAIDHSDAANLPTRGENGKTHFAGTSSTALTLHNPDPIYPGSPDLVEGLTRLQTSDSITEAQSSNRLLSVPDPQGV